MGPVLFACACVNYHHVFTEVKSPVLILRKWRKKRTPIQAISMLMDERFQSIFGYKFVNAVKYVKVYLCKYNFVPEFEQPVYRRSIIWLFSILNSCLQSLISTMNWFRKILHLYASSVCLRCSEILFWEPLQISSDSKCWVKQSKKDWDEDKSTTSRATKSVKQNKASSIEKEGRRPINNEQSDSRCLAKQSKQD